MERWPRGILSTILLAGIMTTSPVFVRSCVKPSPQPTCDSRCQTESDCPTDLTCHWFGPTFPEGGQGMPPASGFCRNPQCLNSKDCQCAPISPTPIGEFCGWPSGGCDSDADCKPTGCNREVCASEPVITPCLWRDCFAPERFGLECGCADGTCQWTK